MAYFAQNAMNLRDWAKGMGPDGRFLFPIEAVAESNPVMDDWIFQQTNQQMGHLTIVRTEVPKPGVKRFNRGTQYSKSKKEQKTDTCLILEARSAVDLMIMRTHADPESYRTSEDRAHLEGFSQKAAELLFYGDHSLDPDEFDGISARYLGFSNVKNTSGYQVINGGSTNENRVNSSAYLIGWGERETTGIFPMHYAKGAGFEMRDLGERTGTDPDGLPLQIYETLYNWALGIAIGDIRSNAVIRNLDTSKFPTDSVARRTFLENFIVAKNRIRNLDNRRVKYCWYVSNEVYTFLELYLFDKNNVHVTRQEILGDIPLIRIGGIPVKKLDVLRQDELLYT